MSKFASNSKKKYTIYIYKETFFNQEFHFRRERIFFLFERWKTLKTLRDYYIIIIIIITTITTTTGTSTQRRRRSDDDDEIAKKLADIYLTAQSASGKQGPTQKTDPETPLPIQIWHEHLRTIAYAKWSTVTCNGIKSTGGTPCNL